MLSASKAHGRAAALTSSVLSRVPSILVMAFALALSVTAAKAQEKQPSSPNLDGRWEIERYVGDGQEANLQNPPKKDFYFKIVGNSWYYSFVVDGKAVMVDLEAASTQLDAVYQGDFKLQHGSGRGRFAKASSSTKTACFLCV